MRSVRVCHRAPADFRGCGTEVAGPLPEDGADAAQRDGGCRRRRRKLRHEVGGDEESNVQGGWRECRKGVSRQSGW